MRHRKSNRRLGRMSAHRKATLKSLAQAILLKESIVTTKVKAMEARSFVDRLITIAKRNTPESKRAAFALLRDKELIDRLFVEVAPRFKTREGGYTRVIPLYPRRGDGAPMAIFELVEKKPKATKKKPLKIGPKKEEGQKKDIKPKEEPKPKKEPKIKEKSAPKPKADVKEEMQKEKAREEQKKVEKKGIFKGLRRFFRGRST